MDRGMHPARRVEGLVESATLALSAKVARLRAAGADVIGLDAGEPDFDTPEHIKRAAAEALAAGQTRYPKPASGLPEAKEAIRGKLERENGLHYVPEQIIIEPGVKAALNLAMNAVLNAGDEVLIPVPYWVSYPEIVKLAGATPVFVPTNESDDFRLTTDRLRAAITERTRGLVLNSPSNPGGFTYDAATLRAIAEVVERHDLVVFADEIYDRLRWEDEPYRSFAGLSDATYARTITFNGASKTYAMTGWRIGYAAGPEPIIRAMAKLQSHGTSGVATFIQLAFAAALTVDQSCVEDMRRQYAERAAFVHARLNALPGVSCVRPTGAFYAFPNVSGTYKALGVRGSVEFADRVLTEALVAVVPGVAFGSDAHVRISYAASSEAIAEAMDRLAGVLPGS